MELATIIVDDMTELHQEPGEKGYRYEVVVSGLNAFESTLPNQPELGALNLQMRERAIVEAVGDVVDKGDPPDAGASYRGWLSLEREGDEGTVVFYALFQNEA